MIMIFYLHQGQCYSESEQLELLTELYNQSGAIRICARNGGILPQIKSDTEMKNLTEYLKAHGIPSVWINRRKRYHERPQWINGAETGKNEMHVSYLSYQLEK